MNVLFVVRSSNSEKIFFDMKELLMERRSIDLSKKKLTTKSVNFLIISHM